MFELIENIKENTILNIKWKEYKVIAKVKYVTEKEVSKRYVKIQLENHYVLVIAPYENYMYFGYVGEQFPCKFPVPNSIKYNWKTYSKDCEDYQIVKEFVFWDILNMEGEVQYADFSNWNSLISLGIITRTNKRADVYAETIELKDVKIN